MPVGVLLRTMDSREITEWMAYYRIQQAEQEKRDLAARAQANTRKAVK